MLPAWEPLPQPAGLVETLLRSTPAGVAVLDPHCRPLLVSPAVCHLLGRTEEELLGSDYIQVFAPGEREAALQRVRDPSVPQRVRYPSRVVRSDGQEREVEMVHFHARLEQRELVAVVLLDVTEERRLVHKMTTLSQFASSLAYAGSLEATLNSLAQKIVESGEALACSVTLLDSRDQPAQFAMLGSFGLPAGYTELVGQLWRSGQPLPSAQAAITGQTVVEQDLPARLARASLSGPATELAAVIQAQPWQTLAAVPLRFGPHCLGSLNCYYRAEARLGEAELTFLRTLADLAAVAVENARLIAAAQEKAALEERARLARELHDSVSQALYGIALGARTARARLEADPRQAAEPLDYVVSLANGGLQEMQALLFALRPEALEETGLVEALGRQADALRARHGLAVQAALPEEPPLDPRQRYALFRVAAEAMHNVVKHARARSVSIRLAWEGDGARLEVDDDGRGFAPQGSFPGHLGLRTMRERAEGLGGSLDIRSAPGQGTHVEAWLPATP